MAYPGGAPVTIVGGQAGGKSAGTVDNPLVVTGGGGGSTSGTAYTGTPPAKSNGASANNTYDANNALRVVNQAPDGTLIDPNAPASVTSTQLPATLGAKPLANSISVAWATDATLPTGSNIIGRVGIDQTTPGTTNAVVARGGVAPGTALSGTDLNPLGLGAVYRANLTSRADGSRTELVTDDLGNLRQSIVGALQNTIADGNTNSVRALQSNSTNQGAPLQTFGYVSNGSQLFYQRGDASGTFGIATPTATAANSLTPVVGAGVTSLVVKASAGNFYGGSMTAAATAGFLIAYNATTPPASGATLTTNLILGVVPVAANSLAALGEYTIPDRCSVGITLLFSTSTTTYTVPANAALHIRGRAA